MFKKRIVLIIILCAIIGGGVFVYVYKNKSGSDNSLVHLLGKRGVGLGDATGFIVTQKSENSFLAERDGDVVKVKIRNEGNEKDAKEYILSQAALLRGLFVPQLPPYPEFLTQQNACDEKYYPQSRKNEYGDFYVLFANDRFGYGICADDLIEYKAGLGIFYCQNNNSVVKVEFFTGEDENVGKIENFMNSFQCI